MENKLETSLREFSDKLLNIADKSNALIDLKADKTALYFISEIDEKFYSSIYSIAKKTQGKIPALVLKDSELRKIDGGVSLKDNFVVDWKQSDGLKNIDELYSLKTLTDNVIRQKGNNPMFLSLGAIKWSISEGENNNREMLSPVFIMPVTLRALGGNNMPLKVAFEEDDIFINPSFLLKFKKEYGLDFPVPENSDSIDIHTFEISDYFTQIANFIKEKIRGKIEFIPDYVVISKYNNKDLCMYYDIKRNFNKIIDNENIKHIFSDCGVETNNSTSKEDSFNCVLAFDKYQREIVEKAIKGDSFVVKGPPGTGKSQTIVNIIAALIKKRKSILFVSQKIAALTEVYNKMPAKIRPFLLRMDYETENLSIDVRGVHSELVEVQNLPAPIAEISKERYNKECSAEWDKYNNDFSEFSGYINTMYNKPTTLGIKLFEVFNKFFSSNFEPIPFNPGDKLFKITYQELLELKNTLNDCGKALDELSKSCYQNDIKNSVFNGVKYNAISSVETIYKTKSSIKLIYEFIQELNKALNNHGFNNDVSSFTICDLKAIIKNDLTKEKRASYLVYDLNKNEEFSINALNKYNENKSEFDLIAKFTNLDNQINIDSININDDLTIKEANYFLGEFDQNVLNYLEGGQESREDRAKLLRNYYNKCFELNVQIKPIEKFCNLNIINEAKELYEALEVFHVGEKKGKKFGLLDFSAKKSIKKALTYFNDNNLSVEKQSDVDFIFDCLKKCVVAEKIKEQIIAEQRTATCLPEVFDNKELNKCNEQLLNNLNLIVRCYEVYAKFDTKLSFIEFINNIKVNYSKLIEICNNLSYNISEELSFGKIKSIINKIKDYKEFAEFINNGNKELCENLKLDTDWQQYYNNIHSLNIIKNKINNQETVNELIVKVGAVIDCTKDINNNINLNNAVNIAETYFSSELFDKSNYSSLSNCTIKNIECINKEVDNYSNLDNYVSYHKIYDNSQLIDIKEFITKYINASQNKYPYLKIAEVFMHSFFYAYIEIMRALIKELDLTLSRSVIEKCINDLTVSENKLFEYNANDSAEEAYYLKEAYKEEFDDGILDSAIRAATCRLLFKNFSEVIRCYKPCLMMSPSTVSQLLVGGHYDNFDVVIFDEASQVPPESAITSIYRAKQCIVFGDEYQMPVMKHFVSNEISEDMGDYISSKSLLDEIQLNKSLASLMLKCHFRSKTESLIEYSADRYYPELITFPSIELYSNDLGLIDNLIPKEEGYCKNGVNEAEAKRVIEVLNEHFEKYYKDGKLLKSIGVVTFGINQKEYIEKLISETKCNDEYKHSLKENIDDVYAFALRNEIPFEKLFFIKTIETVQGQEMDFIVLSLTYGRSEKGGAANNRFYSIGRRGEDALGEKVFNVAVSRAKQSVRLIHSTTSNEIGEGLPYLKQYVSTVEKWKKSSDSDEKDNSTKTKFLSSEPKEGLQKSVYDYVKQLLGEDRVLCNYGIRNKSIKIPIVILDKTKTKAICGIRTEGETQFDFYDYFIRYKKILQEGKGWKLYDVFAFDWYRNSKAEKDNLSKFIKDIEEN